MWNVAFQAPVVPLTSTLTSLEYILWGPHSFTFTRDLKVNLQFYNCIFVPSHLTHTCQRSIANIHSYKTENIFDLWPRKIRWDSLLTVCVNEVSLQLWMNGWAIICRGSLYFDSIHIHPATSISPGSMTLLTVICRVSQSTNTPLSGPWLRSLTWPKCMPIAGWKVMSQNSPHEHQWSGISLTTLSEETTHSTVSKPGIQLYKDSSKLIEVKISSGVNCFFWECMGQWYSLVLFFIGALKKQGVNS